MGHPVVVYWFHRATRTLIEMNKLVHQPHVMSFLLRKGRKVLLTSWLYWAGNIAHVTCLVTLSQLSNTQDLDEKIKSGNLSLRQGSMTAILIPELENTSWLLPKQQLLIT